MTQNRYTPPALEPNTVYHVFSHAVDNNNLFYERANYDFFLKKWAHFSKGYFRTYAFCLMPNHFHLCFQTLAVDAEKLMMDMPTLVQQQRQQQQQQQQQLAASFKLAASLDSNSNLNSNLNSNFDADTIHYHSKRMNSFLSSYAQALNKFRQRKGALFRSKFGRLKVHDVAYFKDLICYIHHNPIHHFGADSYQDWLYSSYNTYRVESEYDFVDTIIAPKRFGSKEMLLNYHEAYRSQKNFWNIENEVVAYYQQYP